jgi:hypothetical protein
LVSDDPGDFVRVALRAQQLLGRELGECAHGLDQSYWDLTVDGATITIQREHYSGVMLCADEPTALALLERYRTVAALAATSDEARLRRARLRCSAPLQIWT